MRAASCIRKPSKPVRQKGDKLKPYVVIAATVVLLAAAVILGLQINAKVNPQAPPKKVRFVHVKSDTSWGEVHPGFLMQAQAREGGRDTAWLSRVIATLPADIYRNGGTIHLQVTQPDYYVLDANGRAYEQADGVLLIATSPDVGIGFELDRIVMKPSKLPTHRRWHEFAVRVPACTPSLGLELLPGDSMGATAMYDGVWISVREPLRFRSAVRRPAQRAGRAKNPCADTLPSGCGAAGAATENCREAAGTKPASAGAAGSLRTGRGRS